MRQTVDRTLCRTTLSNKLAHRSYWCTAKKKEPKSQFSSKLKSKDIFYLIFVSKSRLMPPFSFRSSKTSWLMSYYLPVVDITQLSVQQEMFLSTMTSAVLEKPSWISRFFRYYFWWTLIDVQRYDYHTNSALLRKLEKIKSSFKQKRFGSTSA